MTDKEKHIAVFNHKGFSGTSEYSEEDGCYFGEILGVDDLVMYESDTAEELEKYFIEAVEEYIKLCAELSDQPQEEEG